MEILIVAYAEDDRVAWERVLTDSEARKARVLADVPDADRDLGIAYPLTEADARTIADVPRGLAYFLEACH